MVRLQEEWQEQESENENHDRCGRGGWQWKRGNSMCDPGNRQETLVLLNMLLYLLSNLVSIFLFILRFNIAHFLRNLILCVSHIILILRSTKIILGLFLFSFIFQLYLHWRWYKSTHDNKIILSVSPSLLTDLTRNSRINLKCRIRKISQVEFSEWIKL